MPPSTLRFQTLEVENRPVAAGAPSARGAAVGAGVKLLHKTMKALNGFSVSWRVNREIEKLKPQIDAAIDKVEEQYRQSRPDAGVLVVAGTQEWQIPDATGSRAQAFLGVHVGGAGVDAAAVLRDYLARPKLMRGAARGWRRKDNYIWVTRTR